MDVSKTSALFYSECLLSKNGALASIWVAGCCLKRLKKAQVTDTHIPSCVDKIIQEALLCVPYRILAYLLIGVVRVYSKKVEYLFEDAERVKDKFNVGQEIIPFKDAVRPSHTIILPKSYELDAFVLEVAESACGGHTARNEDITLQDARKDTFKLIAGKKHFGDLSSLHDESFVCDVPPLACIPPQHKISSFTQTPNKVIGDEATSIGAFTPLEVLSPHQVLTDKDISSPDHVKKHQMSTEKLRQWQSEFMDDTFCGVDLELLKLIDEYESQETDAGGENDVQKAVCNNYDPDPDLDPDHVRMPEKEVSPPMEKALESETADARAGTHCYENENDYNTPEFVVISTPAKKEISRRRKRRCIIDSTTVLENDLMKAAINDASSLVKKRTKSCHNGIDIWMASRVPTLSKNFMEPLILCAALEPQHIRCVVTPERMKASTSTLNIAVETTDAIKTPEVASPHTPAIIAPGTPVRGPTSARLFATPEPCDSEGDAPLRSYENTRNDFSVLEDENYDSILVDEMGEDEGDNQGLHKNESRLSSRTITVARYLHNVFHKKKQLGNDSVNLHPILECKTRVETARFFYEILVLSTRGLVNVRQEKAYDDVSLQETAKMEATIVNT